MDSGEFENTEIGRLQKIFLSIKQILSCHSSALVRGDTGKSTIRDYLYARYSARVALFVAAMWKQLGNNARAIRVYTGMWLLNPFSVLSVSYSPLILFVPSVYSFVFICYYYTNGSRFTNLLPVVRDIARGWQWFLNYNLNPTLQAGFGIQFHFILPDFYIKHIKYTIIMDM